MKLNRILLILTLVMTLTANFLANALPLNGLTTGEILGCLSDPIRPGGAMSFPSGA